jgi:hypothetical protein
MVLFYTLMIESAGIPLKKQKLFVNIYLAFIHFVFNNKLGAFESSRL